ncbi:unnamed protein product [Cercospora beticola]|nr:unnamed protein product [Cercospora beticola]
MESARITGVPPSMYYIPNFITPEEEVYILSQIPSNRWITLTHRRLQTLPARLTATNTLVTNTCLPTWLKDPVVDRIHNLGELFEGAPHGINHCLINEYLPGQGIMPHEDGPAYWPVVATVSLGGSLVLDVKAKSGKGEETGTGDADGANEGVQSWRIFQEPRSLLVTTGEAYMETLHGIAEVTEDENLNAQTVANWELLGDRSVLEENEGKNTRTTRISLTYRDVKKVSTIGSKIFGKPKG